MKAILLAGGKGTRLRPLTIHTPKPIVPIFNRPFLHYQIDLLKQVPEIDEVILSLNYQPRRIEEIFGDGSGVGIKIRYVVEPAPLGRVVLDVSSDEHYLLMDGLVLANSEALRVLVARATRTQGGAIVLSDTSTVARTYTGIATVAHEGLQRLSTIACNVSTGLADEWVLSVLGDSATEVTTTAPAIRIRTVSDYSQAHRLLLSGVPGINDIEGVMRSASIQLHTGAYVEGPCFIAPTAEVRSNAVIRKYSAVGEHSIVDSDTIVDAAIILPNSRIGSESQLTACVVGRNSHIGRHVTIRPGTVLADKSVLPDYTLS